MQITLVIPKVSLAAFRHVAPFCLASSHVFLCIFGAFPVAQLETLPAMGGLGSTPVHILPLPLAFSSFLCVCLGFPGGSEVKASACTAEDPGLIPGLGRSPGEGNGTPLQYSGLENPMEGGAWWATVYGVAKSRARRSYFTHFHFRCVYRRERPSEREREVRRERMDGE